jgi:hypothetical protein
MHKMSMEVSRFFVHLQSLNKQLGGDGDGDGDVEGDDDDGGGGDSLELVRQFTTSMLLKK